MTRGTIAEKTLIGFKVSIIPFALLGLVNVRVKEIKSKAAIIKE